MGGGQGVTGMNGWKVFTWGLLCAAGALLFLTMVARAVQRVEQKLDSFAKRERKALEKREDARAALAEPG